jgi:hypothetical protein
LYEMPILLAKLLLEGESCFFATRVLGRENEAPIVEIRVTNEGVSAGGLTLRVQFDRGYYPAAVWWFGAAVTRNSSSSLRTMTRGTCRCTRDIGAPE